MDSVDKRILLRPITKTFCPRRNSSKTVSDISVTVGYDSRTGTHCIRFKLFIFTDQANLQIFNFRPRLEFFAWIISKLLCLLFVFQLIYRRDLSILYIYSILSFHVNLCTHWMRFLRAMKMENVKSILSKKDETFWHKA